MTVTSLQWLICCLWHTANERSQLGVIQHFQISSALCPIKSSHILPEAACTRQVVSHVEGHLGQRNGGGGGHTNQPINLGALTYFQKLHIKDRSSNNNCRMQTFGLQCLQSHTNCTSFINACMVYAVQSCCAVVLCSRAVQSCCAVVLCSRAVQSCCAC